MLTRVYVRDDLSEADKWHARCSHISMKYLKKLGIKTLVGKNLPSVFRCESCIKSKIHRLAHKNLHAHKKPISVPGESAYTDLMGPYSYSLGGKRYGQIFKDEGSTYR